MVLELKLQGNVVVDNLKQKRDYKLTLTGEEIAQEEAKMLRLPNPKSLRLKISISTLLMTLLTLASVLSFSLNTVESYNAGWVLAALAIYMGLKPVSFDERYQNELRNKWK